MSLSRISLPILNSSPSCGSTRPVFGSADVGRYGAVGLDVEVAESGQEDSGSSLEQRKTEDGKRDVFRVSRAERLSLVDGLAHHLVDESHLWIAVEDGKLIVADDVDSELMTTFVGGSSPAEAAVHLERTFRLEGDLAWRKTLAFLGRLAAAGLIRGIRGYHAVKKARPHAFARFHLTNRCQLECVHCYTSSGPHLPSDQELMVDRWVRLVDDFADNGGEKILFTGGEALVYRGCIEVMRRAHARGLHVTLFSNGILIPRHIDELKEIADVVQISVDGPGEESHDAIRGKGSFAKAMRAIHLLLDAGIETRVSTTIMANNWPAIRRDMGRLIAEFEHKKLTFRVSYGAMSHGRGEQLDHSLDTEEVRRFVDGLLARFQTSEDRDNGPNVVQKVSGCGYAEQLVVAPDGLVYPCHLLSGALGHVDDLPLKDITRYLVKTASAFGVDNRLGCGTCDLRNLCGGTCRVDDEKQTGSRLITTCTPEDKLRKKRFLVGRYRPVGEAEATPVGGPV